MTKPVKMYKFTLPTREATRQAIAVEGLEAWNNFAEAQRMISFGNMTFLKAIVPGKADLVSKRRGCEVDC